MNFEKSFSSKDKSAMWMTVIVNVYLIVNLAA